MDKKRVFQHMAFIRTSRYTSLPFLKIVALCLLSCGIMILSSTEHIKTIQWHSWIADHIHHTMVNASKPFLTLRKLKEEWHRVFNAVEDNKYLKKELKNLYYWQQSARSLMVENTHLRAALKILPKTLPLFLTASLQKVMDPRNGTQLILDAGYEQGLVKNQVVMCEGVLIGRLTDVYAKTSKVLPLNDPLSRIPVLSETSNAKAILSGHTQDYMILTHSEGTFVPGEMLFSSGVGGLFPPYLPVGIIQKFSKGEWLVRPLFTLPHMAYGHVLTLHQVP